MATPEGTFPKVGNDPFYVSEIGSIMNIGVKLFGNSFQTILNADKAGFTANVNERFKNLHFDSLKADTMTGDNFIYNSTKDIYVLPDPSTVSTGSFATVDEFTEINAGSWFSGGTPTIVGNALFLDSDKEFLDSAFTFINNNKLIRISKPAGTDGNTASNRLDVYLVGTGSAVIAKYTRNQAGQGGALAQDRIFTIILTPRTAFSYDETVGSYSQYSVDPYRQLGSQTSYGIKLELVNTDTADVTIDFIKEYDWTGAGSHWTGSIVSTGSDFFTTLSNAGIVSTLDGSGGIFVSTNSGTNYNRMTLDTFTTLSNTGSISRVMFQSISGVEPMMIFNYGVTYNLL
ncbi:MAG: hypothetical protein IIA87_03735 [Nanoarchaeota archaeon]|nr:hypothetical protein [Nanoarchaeota archaeon]